MTVKTMKKVSSELAIASNHVDHDTKIPASVMETWTSLSKEVRLALMRSELSVSDSKLSNTTHSSFSSSSSDNSDDSKEIHETCPKTGEKIVLQPVERAPQNVFKFEKTSTNESVSIEKDSNKVVTTKTKIVSTSKGWRNTYNLPISYDVNMVPHGTIFDPSNLQLLYSTGPKVEGYNRRFAVIDNCVDEIYGDQIRNYFKAHGIELSTCIVNGGEADKRPDAVDKLLDELCVYKLRRREPFLAIGGGVLLDIAGMAACLYRRGVPFVRVPTTLLAIVDASVGVKNGVDYCCQVTNDTYKNRVGSFYAPSSCLLDNSFIASQDRRNVANGIGEILKLALVRSTDLFDLLESHGAALIESRFAETASVPNGVSDRIIELSIEIMLEELGPNLWEYKLDRCVDYGHTFSKLLEMVPGADIMHGEAVNVDGFFCVVLSHLRGYIDMDTVMRVFNVMKSLSLPSNSADLDIELAWQSCKDAVEHRHGAQRIPLITEIGASICVSDITKEELGRAVALMKTFDH